MKCIVQIFCHLLIDDRFVKVQFWGVNLVMYINVTILFAGIITSLTLTQLQLFSWKLITL